MGPSYLVQPFNVGPSYHWMVQSHLMRWGHIGTWGGKREKLKFQDNLTSLDDAGPPNKVKAPRWTVTPLGMVQPSYPNISPIEKYVFIALGMSNLMYTVCTTNLIDNFLSLYLTTIISKLFFYILIFSHIFIQ